MSIVKILSSLKITLGCLILLFILTFWGTIDQVQNGLYHAQERFFHSFYFLVFGFLPFPGAQLVLWILFVNLVCAAFGRFEYQFSKLGIFILHIGVILWCVSAFVTLHGVEESHLTLREKEGANVSQSYRDWELSIWREEPGRRIVTAYDAKPFKGGQVLDFSEFGFDVLVKTYYPNAEAYAGPPSGPPEVFNPSGIQALEPLTSSLEPEKNVPGGIFVLKQESSGAIPPLLLYGAENNDAVIPVGKEVYHFRLRHKKYPLPLGVRLIDFVKEDHPNTEIARSYKSKVELRSEGGLSRGVEISMNQPLRYKNFTFYQASYAVDARGREISTFAVVKNSGRWLPYLAGLVTFAGLVTHFVMMAFQRGVPGKILGKNYSDIR